MQHILRNAECFNKNQARWWKQTREHHDAFCKCGAWRAHIAGCPPTYGVETATQTDDFDPINWVTISKLVTQGFPEERKNKKRKLKKKKVKFDPRTYDWTRTPKTIRKAWYDTEEDTDDDDTTDATEEDDGMEGPDTGVRTESVAIPGPSVNALRDFSTTPNPVSTTYGYRNPTTPKTSSSKGLFSFQSPFS